MESFSKDILDQIFVTVTESARFGKQTVLEVWVLVKLVAISLSDKFQSEISRFHQKYPEFSIPYTTVVVLLVITLCSLIFHCCRKGRKSTHQKPVNLSTWNAFDLSKTAYLPGHTEAVIKLVDKFGYDVNYVVPSSGLSLFLCACLSGDKQLITYMLSKGGDIHIKTRDGDSALYLATYGVLNSQKEDTTVLVKLIKAGCGVNTPNDKGYTPLHRAASKGNMTVIRCLLKHGADPYLSSKVGVYPIDSAINAGHLDAAELLKIDIVNPHVWDLVDPHTPPRIQLGLQSPARRQLMESSKPRTFSKMLT